MRSLRVVALIVLGVLLIVGASIVGGLIRLPIRQDVGRPPCEQLPSKRQVVDALAAHGDLVTQIQNVGPGVKVEVASPCKEEPEKALVSVEYATKSERNGIDSILRAETGFGVPVQVVSG